MDIERPRRLRRVWFAPIFASLTLVASASVAGTASLGNVLHCAPETAVREGIKAIEATLADSEAARDFASLLPLTLPMNDLFRRERFAALPRAISEQGKRTHDHGVGTIG